MIPPIREQEGTCMKGDRAGIWVRVSTGRQEAASQLPDCLTWCQGHDCSVEAEYRIHGQSAFKSRWDDGRVVRPRRLQEQLDQVWADMDAGKIDVLVVWALDRIERSGTAFA